MKKFILISIAVLFVISTTNTWAQRLVALEHNGQMTTYFKIDSALAHAVDGDIIYLPGGSFSISSSGISITKKLKIYGVGHYPDSTIATTPTYITGGPVYIKTGADSGSISGIYMWDLIFGSTSGNQVVNNYTISRCKISNLQLAYATSAITNPSQNVFVSENVITGTLYGGYIQGSLYEKNIFNNNMSYVNGAIFKNNIFLQINTSSPYLFFEVTGCTFENNIIRQSTGYMWSGGSTTNNYYNNIFIANITFPYSLNYGSGNKVNINADSIFVNQSGNFFSYSHNYHLKSTSVGKNAGTDGTDIGIYGTSAPYKESAVPENPHIQYKSIAPQTNSNGKLNVNIKTKAQER